MKRIRLVLGIVLLGIVAAGITLLDRRPARSADASSPSNELKALKAELAALEDLLPDQSHAMSDVGYHYSNLWFAAKARNWTLADFYFNETRSHLHWAVRIKPIRKDNANRDVNLPAILQAMENGPLKQVGDAITAKNQANFVKWYRLTLENCYACHKASDKPYLRPQIPSEATAIINVDPKATWPL